METELRRRRTNLLTLGAGVIAFGVWSMLKTYLYMIVDPIPMTFDVPEQFQQTALVMAYAMVTAFLLIDLALRLYIGLSARAEGLGSKKGKAYIIVTALMLVVNIAAWIVYLFMYDYRDGYEALMDYVVSLVVDFTSIVILAQLIYNAILVRRLSRQLEG